MARRTHLDPRATARVRQLHEAPATRTSPRRAVDLGAVGVGVDRDRLASDQVGRALGFSFDNGLDSGFDHGFDNGLDRRLAVVGCLVVLALLLAGWAVLRARPVALAEPIRAAGTAAATGGSPSSDASPAASDSPAASGEGAASAAPESAAPSASASPPSGGTIEVHVLGAVRRPGLVRLTVGARVADALTAADGLRADANPGRLNLAQPLSDGQQVFVGRRGGSGSEIRDPAVVDPAGGTADGSSPTTTSRTSAGGNSTGGAATHASSKVDLNAADVTQLDALPGVGPVTAGKIIAWRDQHGRFSRVEELQEVDGIGPKTYADLAQLVTV